MNGHWALATRPNSFSLLSPLSLFSLSLYIYISEKIRYNAIPSDLLKSLSSSILNQTFDLPIFLFFFFGEKKKERNETIMVVAVLT